MITGVSCSLSEVEHGIIGQGDNKVTAIVDDNRFYAHSCIAFITLVALIAFVTLDIGYNNSNEHIAVHRKGDFGLIDFGKQLTADIPAFKNIGRIKRYGCGKHGSLSHLVTACDFFASVFNRKNTSIQSRWEGNGIFGNFLNFYRNVCFCLDCAGFIHIAAVTVVNPRIRICKAVVFMRLDSYGNFIAVANGFAAYKIFISVFNGNIGVLRVIHRNFELLDFGEIHLNIGFSIGNNFAVILAVRFIIDCYGFNLISFGYDKLLHTVIFRRLCGKVNFRADGNTCSGLIALFCRHTSGLIAACGRICQAYTHGNIKFHTDLGVLCNSHGEAFTALSCGILRPHAEFTACIRLCCKGQHGIHGNIYAVIFIQDNTVAVCIGNFNRAALFRYVDLYKPADFRKAGKFRLNGIFFGSKSQRIGV